MAMVMLTSSTAYRSSRIASRRLLALPPAELISGDLRNPRIYFTKLSAPFPWTTTKPSSLPPLASSRPDRASGAIRSILSSSSFSALSPEEEREEKARVDAMSPYQKEIELRQLDSKLARLQTRRAINTGELYTLRGKFKMLSRDYGMGFLAWYWTVWFATAGMSYAAIEMGGIDPLVVAGKVEAFLGWEPTSIAGRLDPTLGQIGLVIAVNECLEPLRLPIVVVTTKPVVNFFNRSS